MKYYYRFLVPLFCLLFGGVAHAGLWDTLKLQPAQLKIQKTPITTTNLLKTPLPAGTLQIKDVFGPTQSFAIPYDHSLLRGSYSLHAKFPSELALQVKSDIWNRKTYVLVSALNVSQVLQMPEEGPLTTMRDLRQAASVFCSEMDAASGGFVIGCLQRDSTSQHPYYFHYQGNGTDGTWKGAGESTTADVIKVAACNSHAFVIAYDDSLQTSAFQRLDSNEESLPLLNNEPAADTEYHAVTTAATMAATELRPTNSNKDLLDLALNRRQCGLGVADIAPGAIFHLAGYSATNYLKETTMEPYNNDVPIYFPKLVSFQNPHNINELNFLFSYFHQQVDNNSGQLTPFLVLTLFGDFMAPQLVNEGSASVPITGKVKSVDIDSNLKGEISQVWESEVSGSVANCTRAFVGRFTTELNNSSGLGVVKDGEPMELGSACGSEKPVVAVGEDGHVLAAWQASDGDGSYSIYARYFDPNSHLWSAAKKLSGDLDSRYPRVTMDAAGEGVVAWVAVNPATQDAFVEARRLHLPAGS